MVVYETVMQIFTKLKNLRYGRNLRSHLSRFIASYRLIDKLIISTKIFLYPFEFIVRKYFYVNVIFFKKEIIDISKNDYFFKTNISKFNSKKLIDECNSIYMKKKKEKNSDYLNNLLDEEDVLNNKSILNFATSDKIINAAALHLKTYPCITSVQLWLSKKTRELKGSQYYHFDQIHPRQFKIIVNVNDVNNENGPFVFIPEKASKKLRSSKNWHKSFLDSELKSITSEKRNIKRHVGKKGSLLFVDSSNCLHSGSRIKKGQRLVLMIQYAPFHSVKETSDYAWQKISKIFLDKGSNNYLKKYLFKLPPSPFLEN